MSDGTGTSTGPAPHRPAASLFILITVVLDMTAAGIVIPVWPRLIQTVAGGGLDRAALLLGLFSALFAVMQFVTSPIQGALSDRFGRRPIILASNFGVGASYVLLALAPDLIWLLAARVVSGIAAGSISTAYAYLADVNPPDRRAASFGLIGGAYALGLAVGPAIGGLAGEIDPRAPFWLAASLSLANGLYGLFVLPESLSQKHRAAIDWKRLNPIGALAGLVSDYPRLFGLGVGAILLTLSGHAINSVAVLYTTHRYGWTPAQIGVLMTLMGFLSLGVQAGLTRVAIARLGEEATRTGGLLLQAGAIAWLCFAPNGPAYVVGCIALSLGGVAGPAWQAMMSRQVGPKDQGRLAGAAMGITSITGMAAPPLFTGLFALAVHQDNPWLPVGAPFLLAAAMGCAAALLALAITRRPATGRATD